MHASRPVATFLAAAMMVCLTSEIVSGQTSSIARRFTRNPAAVKDSKADPRGLNAPRGNPTLERFGLTSVKVKPPRLFKTHDLITIIIREQRKFESDGSTETKKKFDIKSEIGAFLKLIDGTVGSTDFTNGHPNIQYKYNQTLKNEADKDREDRFTTRITGEIIDIKPNGNLVLQAKADLRFENEVSIITLTGVVRSEDVTPDNTVLSTQLADKVIDVQNKGSVRDGTRRGWIPRFLDFIRPF